MGFFKNLFSKQACVLCGKECGVMRRTKLQDKQYICDDCGNKCSKYVRLSRMTVDDVKGHIAYMERQQKLYDQVFSKAKKLSCHPNPNGSGIEFCDELGMFRIIDDRVSGRGKMKELFRYDQVASYEEYYTETKGENENDPPEFDEGGLIVRLVGTKTDLTNQNPALRPHPYIRDELKICFSNRERHEAEYAHIAKQHFDHIFGVNDDSKPLFGFGKSVAEQREEQSDIAMAQAFATVISATKKGGSGITDEVVEKMQDSMNAVNDANSGGLSVYSRRADKAEAKISV